MDFAQQSDSSLAKRLSATDDHETSSIASVGVGHKVRTITKGDDQKEDSTPRGKYFYQMLEDNANNLKLIRGVY